MKLTLFLVATLLVAFAQSQNNVLNFIIDDFGWGNGASLVIDGTDYAAGIEQQAVEVKLTANINVPAEDTNSHIVDSDDTDITGINYVYGFDPCAFLVGCVRNMEVRIWNGLEGREFTSNIFSSSFTGTGYDGDAFAGEWAISSPKSSNSRYTLQYDSTVGMNLNLQGLGGIDITVGGLAREITFFVITDLNADFVVELFDVNGNGCTGVINVVPEEAGQGEYDISEFRYSLSLDRITGSCSQTSIGAIQLSIESNDALDAIIRRFSVFGVPPPSNSNTPSPVPSPSGTGTGTPIPSASPTRPPTASNTPTSAPSQSNTPSTSGPCIIQCTCPSFTCQIVYDFDGVNNVVSRRTSIFWYDDSDTVIQVPGTPVPVPVVTLAPRPDFSITDGTITIPSATIDLTTQTFITLDDVDFSTDIDDDDDDDNSGSPSADDDDDNNSGSSPASALVVSIFLVVIAALF